MGWGVVAAQENYPYCKLIGFDAKNGSNKKK